jgi:hypothetical protein
LASPEVAVGRQGKNELEIWEGDNIVFSLFPLKTQKYIEHKEIDLEKDQDEREKFRKDQAQRLREWAKRSLLKHTQKQSFNSKTISTHSDTTSGATSAAAADCERRLPDIKPVVAVVGDTDESGPERGQCVVMRTPREARWQPEAKDAAASDGDLPWPIGARNQVSETLNGALDNIIAKPVVPSWDGVENDSQENKASFFQTSTKDPYIEYTEALFKGRIPRIKEVIDQFFEITRKRPRDPTWAMVRELVDGTIPTAKMFVWTIAHTLCSSRVGSAEVDFALANGKGKASIGVQTAADGQRSADIVQERVKLLNPPKDVLRGMGKIELGPMGDDDLDLEGDDVSMDIDDDTEKRLLQD